MIPQIDPDYPISFVEACNNTFLPVRGRGKNTKTIRYKPLNAYTLPAVVPRRIVMALTNIKSERTLAVKFRIIQDPAHKKGVLKSDLVRWFSNMRVVSNPLNNLMIRSYNRNENILNRELKHKSNL